MMTDAVSPVDTQIDPTDGNLSLRGLIERAFEVGTVGIQSRVGGIVAANPEAERLLQGHLNPLVGQKWSRLPEQVRIYIQETLEASHSLPSRVVEWNDSNGEVARVRLRGLFADEILILTLQDLQLARQLQQNLHHLDRLANVGLLSASIAHEIKNALAFVKTIVGLLQEGRAVADSLPLVQQEVDRIGDTARQLLQLAGPGQHRHETFAVHDILDNSLQLVQHQLSVQNIRLSRNFWASSCDVHGDSRQFELAIINLLVNAIEAMVSGGELTVTTELLDVSHDSAPAGSGREGQCHRLRIVIQDTGPGIREADRARIFDRFYTSKSGGTGLGLAITRNIVQAFDGEISVWSNPGTGTAFEIELPLATAQ